MKKWLILCWVCLLMSGCAMFNSEKPKDDKKEQRTTTRSSKTVENKDEMESLLNYFKEKQVDLNQLQKIDANDFDAYDAFSFKMNNENVYLYHLNQGNDMMAQLLTYAKNNGKVKVNVNDQNQEYVAHTNGSFLLLYPQSVDAQMISDVFENYTVVAPTGPIRKD